MRHCAKLNSQAFLKGERNGACTTRYINLGRLGTRPVDSDKFLLWRACYESLEAVNPFDKIELTKEAKYQTLTLHL